MAQWPPRPDYGFMQGRLWASVASLVIMSKDQSFICDYSCFLISMFKLPYNCAHFTCQQGSAQNPPREASTACDLRTSRYTSWIQKRQKNQRSYCQHPLDHRKSKRIPEKESASLTTLKPFTVCITTNWKTLQEMGIPDHLTCLLRNLYAGQEATVRIRHGTTDWFQIRKGVQSRLYIVNLLT